MVSFRYRGQSPTFFMCQEVGHASKDCPKSWGAQKQAQQQQDGNKHKNKQGQDDLKINVKESERTVSALDKQQSQVDLREKINTLRAAKLAPSKAATSRSTSQVNDINVKEADTSLGQSSKGAKAEAAAIDPRGEAVHSAPGEADLMDTRPPSSPRKNSEAGKAKGRVFKGGRSSGSRQRPTG